MRFVANYFVMTVNFDLKLGQGNGVKKYVPESNVESILSSRERQGSCKISKLVVWVL